METVTQGAAIVGLINLIGILLPGLDQRYKVALVVIIGALVPFVPLANPVVQGVMVALASSGVYKVAQVVRAK